MDNFNLLVEDLSILVQRKKIKNLNLSILPPEGSIRLSIPLRTSKKDAKQMILEKYQWIKQKQAMVRARPKPSKKKMHSGERFPYRGTCYELEIIECALKKGIVLMEDNKLKLYAKTDSTTAQRESLLQNWYHVMLEEQIPPLIVKWEPIIGKHVASWGIRRMKTQWGSCHIEKKHIQLNLDLIQKPPECLEYVIVHEMVHLYERYHNAQFKQYMDRFMPNWRTYKEMLNG